jgi:tetratricopeptide (TPR) repeat protein
MLPEPLEEPVEERQSWPSEDIGTSPSAVADALGKLMSSAPPPAVADHDKTIAQPAIFENNDAARGRIAFSIPPRGADNKDAFRDLPPTAKGTLTATPLVHVLVYMFDHALSGTVVFRDPEGGESVVYFLEGAPAKVKTHRAIALLGDELVAAGAVTREVVSKAIDSAKRLGVLLGEYLRGNSLVSADALARALEVQVRKKVASLVNLSPDTGYCFYRDVNALDSWAGEQLTPCHPLDAVLACARDWYDRARIHATLNRLGKQALVLHGDVDLSPLALTDEEEQVLAVMRAEGPPLQNLYQRRFADEETISSLVYMLAVTRQFSFAKAPPMRWTGRPRVSRPAERAALPLSAIVEPRPPSIPPRGEAKLGKSAGTWRPPRPADDDGGIDVEVSVESSHPPPRSDDTAERALQAMTDFRLAETAMQRNDLQMAERLARRALDQDPHQAEYRAAVEWLRAMNAPASLGEAIEALGNMLEKDPTHERTLLYRARLLKKAGRVRDALRDFEAILAQNPRHSEAASESRHLKTRR